MILEAWPPEDQALRPYDKWVINAYGLVNKSLYDIDPDDRKHWNDCLEAFYYDQNYTFGRSVAEMLDHLLSGDDFRDIYDGPWNYENTN